MGWGKETKKTGKERKFILMGKLWPWEMGSVPLGPSERMKHASELPPKGKEAVVYLLLKQFY